MRRFLVTTALAVAALLAAPAAGQAADGAEIALFADTVAATWVPHQNASGMFIDPILGRGSAYGTTMLGYGLLRAGVR
ncbi:MAG: MBL fold metallo-hydrolase, partial [Solirubrobacteraceae bacterium]